VPSCFETASWASGKESIPAVIYTAAAIMKALFREVGRTAGKPEES